ncbi:MAG: carbamoyltransferase N-terminal domain-containing protein [Methanosarcinales archaeon]
MYILGISCFYHDAAACILKDGAIVAAAQEERFTRIKHDYNFPKNAINYCLKEAGITIKDVDYVGFYDMPLIKFERILKTYISVAPKGIRSFIKAIPMWLRQKLWMRDLIKKELDYDGEIIFTEHHQSHAASAFFASPYEESAKMTNKKFDELFGYPRREPESKLQKHHFDIAMSIQRVTEDIMLKMANYLYDETEMKNLCMAGGVALNSVANGRILRETPFENLFIQPAAGDAGGAIGVASFIYYSWLENKRYAVGRGGAAY